MKSDSGGNSAGKWILISLVVVAILLFLCCGGCALVFQAGVGEMGDQAKLAVEDHPLMVEHIGEIDDFDFSWGETIGRAGGGQTRLAFEVSGSKGSGVLSAIVDTSQQPAAVLDAVLEVNGEEFELTEE